MLTSSKLAVGKWLIDFDLSDAKPKSPTRLIHLHGLTGSRARDEALGLNLADGLPVNVLRYDAPGHGKTQLREGEVAVPEDFTWEALAEVLPAFVEGRTIALGQSMGTATALTAAVNNPGMFDALVLALPPTIWQTRVAQAGEYEKQARFVEQHGRAAFAASQTGELPPAVDPARPHTEPDVAEDVLPTVFRGAALADLPPREEIARIDCPVLVLAWPEDPAHPLSSAEELVSLMPHAECIVAHTPAEVAQWPRRIAEFIAAG